MLSLAASNYRLNRKQTIALLALAASSVSCLAPADGTTVTSTWTGATNNSWENGPNWNPTASYPNNGNAGISDYIAIVPNVTPEPTMASQNITLDALSLNTGATMLVTGCNLTLTSTLGFTDNGTMFVGDTSFQQYATTVTINNGALSGSGNIVLGSNLINSGTDSIAGIITISSTSSISGGGPITATLTNHGLVNANSSVSDIYLTAPTLVNTSTMEASSQGLLDFAAGITITNTGGTILANGAGISLTSDTINGGTLSTTNNGSVTILDSSSVTFSGITNSASLNTSASDLVTFTGNLLDNGQISIDSDDTHFSTISFSGGTLSGFGSLRLNAGSLSVLAGSLTQASGHNITGAGHITASITNNGIISANLTGETLVLASPVAGTGTVSVTSGAILAMSPSIGSSIVGKLSVASTGKLDLANNHIFINYGATDPISSIAAWISSGYNAGAWNGPGIDSSIAAMNSASYGIGYPDSADPGNPAGLSSRQIEVKYTLLGDLNLDGTVNGVDFGTLAANFNHTVSRWDQGDFNYDNIVNGVDFGELAANFNKGASGASTGESALSDPALVAFAEANGLMADVPEPAGLAALSLAWPTLLLRCRRWPSPP
jgi:hypothetical protein